MILIIDTTEKHMGKELEEKLLKSGKTPEEFECVDTTGMNISPCLGCNNCWLKTPGKCMLQDDYEPILRKMNTAEQVWLLSDTSFGFLKYKAKNIIDRIMPLVTMYLEMKNKEMRHVMRYENRADLGLIYTGEGNRAYLNRWCERMTLNFGSSSLGAYPEEHMEEAITCM